MTIAWNPLRRIDPYPLERQRGLADRIGALLSSSGSTVLVPGEAIVALEAVARALGRPGVRALNIVTSPYGGLFGQWLTQAGAEVLAVAAEPGRPVDAAAVQEALQASGGVEVVVLVHGEAASGIVNPLEEIAALAAAVGAITVVDAVASVGAHVLEADRQGLDVVVTGPQKALGGPASLSAVTLGPRGAALLRRDPVQSSVVLPEPGAVVPLGTADPLSFWALEAALDAVDAEGLGARIERHARAAGAARAGLRALSTGPWIQEDDRASHLVTAAPVPGGTDAAALLRGIQALDPAAASAGVGPAADRFVRLNHTGERASFAPVLSAVVAYGHALAALGEHVDIGAGAEAVARAFG
jgi:aspartate aminotransferase-like enzyme